MEDYGKILRYCAYRERCTLEVREKLRQAGVPGAEAEALLARLRAENYLNEERYARAYVRGKFRINGWGRIKIQAGLRAKGVPQNLISLALKEEIDPEEYTAALRKIVAEKGEKTALSRGFEVAAVLGSGFVD